MPYHNYRERKKKGLAILVRRTALEDDKEQVSFRIHSKRFSEREGTELPFPEISLVETEALKKEIILLQGYIEDIDEILSDMEA